MAAKLIALLLAVLSLGQSAVNEAMDQMSLGGILFLVNRDYPIESSYVPNDLTHPKVDCVYSDITMRAEAAHALEDLFGAAKEEAGYNLVAVSGYRSYGKQAAIHQRKVSSVGKKAALRISAPPGCSEHQLGLAMDIGRKKSPGLTEAFGSSPEGIWVAENCARFGFIIRYKAEWEEITGYAYEPWHIRYVGREHAERITELDIPFEYYIAQLRQLRSEWALEGE